MNKNIKLLIDNLPSFKRNFKELTSKEVFVGVPSGKANRKDSKEPNNAMLAYIHDNGSPARNIPARPFMKPGIERAQRDIEKAMEIGAKQCLDGATETVDIALHRVGLIAQRSIRNRINEGISPPLAESTLKARIRNKKAVKGALAELKRRAAGKAASATVNAKPLIQTGQLRNSINYVIKDK